MNAEQVKNELKNIISDKIIMYDDLSDVDKNSYAN